VPAADISTVSASDNCGTPTVTFVGDVSSTTNQCGRTITRTYKATDACGNFSTCTQTIIVNSSTSGGGGGNVERTIPTNDVPLTIKEESDKLSVTAYPNPYQHEVNFQIVSPLAGRALLEVYNTMGQKLAVVNNANITTGKSFTVRYNVPPAQRGGPLFYRLTVGKLIATGTLIPGNK